MAISPRPSPRMHSSSIPAPTARPLERELSSDVTSKWAAELESRYRLLFDSKLMGIGYCDGMGRLVDANDALLSMLGRNRAELDGAVLTTGSVLSPATDTKLREHFAQDAHEGIPPFEGECLHRSGASVAVLVGGGFDVAVDRGVFFALDIRDRKYAEQSQRFITEAGNVLASSLDYEVTLEQAAHLAVPTYADWCFVDVLQEDGGSFDRVVVAHAFPEHAELAQSLRRTFPGEALSTSEVPPSELYVHLTDEQLEQQAAKRPHLEFLRGLGIISYMVVPLALRQQLIGYLTFASTHWNYDANNLRCAEELARRAAMAIDSARLYRDAQAATRAREEFLSMASHELKSPLTSLKLQLQNIQRIVSPNAGLDETALKKLGAGLESIRRGIDRQSKLVDTLLDVSRISVGRLALEPEEFDLAVLVRELATRFDHELTRMGMPLRIECPPTLKVTWDRIRTDQILTNLLSNAIKYGCRKPIDLLVSPQGKNVRITVCDRGIGISDKDRARIFGQFERAVSERNFGGFGLGLWITHSIIQAMGGSISVESALGSGSTFTVQLPQRMA